jgi:hypothetical protein
MTIEVSEPGILKWASLALAVGVLIAGVPNLTAQFAAMSGDPAATLLYQGMIPGKEGFGRLLRSRERALGSAEIPSWRIETGVARLMQALVAAARDGSDPSGPMLDEAREQLRAGLARGPADAMGWFWLAVLEEQRGDQQASGLALKLSLLTAPVRPEITFPRCLLGLLAWSSLDDGTRSLVARELVRALERTPEDLLAAADRIGRSEELRAALVGEPRASLQLKRAH